MKNEILLRNCCKIVVPNGNYKVKKKWIQALCLDISQFGYSFSKNVLKALGTLSPNDFRNFHKDIVDILSKIVGANVKYQPLFRNFPNDVPDDLDYFFNRVLGYLKDIFNCTYNGKQLSCGHIIDINQFDLSNFGACPICQMQVDENNLDSAKARSELKDKIKFKIIDLGSDDDFKNMFSNLVGSKSSISESNKSDITSIVDLYKTKIKSWLPKEIPFKENLVFITKTLMESGNPDFLFSYYKTVTDVLRLASGLSGGDISLADNTKFKKFSRPERKFILSLLEKTNLLIDDMCRHKNRWIRLGERLHPSEYESYFPKSAEAFRLLRNTKIETFNGKVQKALDNKKWSKAISLLENKPGEFARKIDLLLRNSRNNKAVINHFNEVIDKVSTPVLIQLWGHLKSRNNLNFRSFMPKGTISKIQVVANNLPKINDSSLEFLIEDIKDELRNRFRKLPSLGHVLIDENLKNFPLALSQRAASKTLVTLPRGSRVKIDADCVRLFLYWKQKLDERTDIDLSAIIYDKNWNYKTHLSWTSLSSIGGYHSGDIQSAPNGAAEFIDLNLDKLDKDDYVIMSVYSWTGQPFVNLPECFAGFMERKHPNSGEIFEPTTVQNKYDLTVDRTCSIPIILDVKNREMVWADLASSRYSGGSVERSKDATAKMGMAVTNFVNTKVTLYELAELHIEVRGKSLNKKHNKYDTIFGVNEGTYKATDILLINKELL